MNEPTAAGQIKRWVVGTYHYIGDQMINGAVTHTVMQARVELIDGREMDAWLIIDMGNLLPLMYPDGLTGQWTRSKSGSVVFVKPHIDRLPGQGPGRHTGLQQEGAAQ